MALASARRPPRTLAAHARADGVHLQVLDTGEGIPVADLPFICDRFGRGDRARSHTGGSGSGLGLSSANQLVRAHGGEMTVTNEPGRGTTVEIRLLAAAH